MFSKVKTETRNTKMFSSTEGEYLMHTILDVIGRRNFVSLQDLFELGLVGPQEFCFVIVSINNFILSLCI